MAQIEKNVKVMPLPLAIERVNPVPVDSTSVWYSQEELEQYAKSALAYVGQTLALVDEAAETAKVFIITDKAGTVKQLGAGGGSTDGVSIEADAEGNIRLKDFKQSYYAYVPKTETEAAKYVKTAVDETHPWKTNLVPKITPEGELGWYEPGTDATTEEIVGNITTINNILADLKSKVNALSGAFNFKGKKDTFDDLPKNAATGDVWQVADKEYAWNGTEWVEFGSEVNLDNYVTKTELATLDKKVGNLAGVVGNAASEGVAATGLVKDVADLNSALKAANTKIDTLSGVAIKVLKVNGSALALDKTDNSVNIPLFSVNGAGLVPSAGDKDENYFLTATGSWAKPIDGRIGNLTINDTKYNTVEEFVSGAINDAIEWKTIS